MKYDETQLRYLQTKEEIEKLPIKETTEEEKYEVYTKMTFNPLFFYPKDVAIIESEYGYDDEYRYILK